MSDSLNIQTSLRAANIARQAEWDPSDKITLTYRLNELAGETGEACNVGKKIERERLGIRGSRDTVEHLAEELADVVICADLVAMAEGIDLDAAVAAKFNATSEKVGLRTRLAAPAPGGAVLADAVARVSAWANYPHTTAEQIAVTSQASTFTAGDLRVILAALATREEAPAESGEDWRAEYNRIESIREAAEGQDRIARGTADPIARSDAESQASGHWDRYNRELAKFNDTATLRAQPQAREDAQPVAPRNCEGCNVPPLHMHEEGCPVMAEALAVLQAEQKGGAA